VKLLGEPLRLGDGEDSRRRDPREVEQILSGEGIGRVHDGVSDACHRGRSLRLLPCSVPLPGSSEEALKVGIPSHGLHDLRPSNEST
jgi:hypothetical protein